MAVLALVTRVTVVVIVVTIVIVSNNGSRNCTSDRSGSILNE